MLESTVTLGIHKEAYDLKQSLSAHAPGRHLRRSPPTNSTVCVKRCESAEAPGHCQSFSTELWQFQLKEKGHRININQVDPSVTILMTPFGSIIGIPLDDLSMFLSTRILQVTANPRFRHQTWLCCKLRQGPAWRGSNHSRENQP
jgi:hypothetical protein